MGYDAALVAEIRSVLTRAGDPGRVVGRQAYVKSAPWGRVLLAHREAVTPVMDAWAVEEDLWLRRTAIGWALREHAKTYPAWVVALLDRYADSAR